MNRYYLYISLEGKDILVGTITSSFVKADEIFSFEFSKEYLSNPNYPLIDPRLFLFSGVQYDFGFLNDMTPDRFGTMLIDRYEQAIAAKENRAPKKLSTSDYLERTNDLSRMGALRIKKELDSPFLNDDKEAIPPYLYLKDIEYASITLEEDGEINDALYQRLLLPGSSLGGARPKASIYYQEEVYLAKFPSKKDAYDVELWEYIANRIASHVGIEVPDTKLEKYSDYGHTLLLKRFDRNKGHRIHYLSAVTALGAKDGESGNYSYLDLANFINSNCSDVRKNLRELYKRMIFTYLINSTDNHLRNHAFVYQNNEYRLSPMYDVNPTFFFADFELPFGLGNTNEALLEIAPFFYIDYEEAKEIYGHMKKDIKERISFYVQKYPEIKKEATILLKILESR